MYREILFRGFYESENGTEQIQLDGKVIKGKWVEGFYFKSHIERYNPLKEEKLVSYIKWQVKENNETYNQYEEVLPETVCQYTGLIDKNGRKIFENDLIRALGTYPLQVEYENEQARFIATYKGKRSGHCDDDNDTYADGEDLTFFEIIGNKWEVEK